MQMLRSRAALITRRVSISLLVGIFCSNVSLSAPPSEMQTLTIAFLYNFMKLSEWPTGVTADGLTLCVTEGRDFSKELDSIIGKPIQNKTLLVKRLTQGDNPNGCQLLFLPSEEKLIRLREWLKLIENKPVLTVSDMPEFLDEGGMIVLVSDGNHLQFEVDLWRAERVGIKMSSKMLQIAREVRGK
jgi:YfiR/HmsC-like